MKPMTQEEYVKACLKNDGAVCPYCGSTELSALDGDGVTTFYDCMACGKPFRFWLELSPGGWESMEDEDEDEADED